MGNKVVPNREGEQSQQDQGNQTGSVRQAIRRASQSAGSESGGNGKPSESNTGSSSNQTNRSNPSQSATNRAARLVRSPTHPTLAPPGATPVQILVLQSEQTRGLSPAAETAKAVSQAMAKLSIRIQEFMKDKGGSEPKSGEEIRRKKAMATPRVRPTRIRANKVPMRKMARVGQVPKMEGILKLDLKKMPARKPMQKDGANERGDNKNSQGANGFRQRLGETQPSVQSFKFKC